MDEEDDGEDEVDLLVVVALIPAGAEESRIDRTYACCFCSLPLLHAAAVAVAVAVAAGRSCCCTTAPPASSAAGAAAASAFYPTKNTIFSVFSFPIMRIAEGLQLRLSLRRKSFFIFFQAQTPTRN